MHESGSEVGAQRRRRAQGRRHQALQDSLQHVDAEVARWADDFVFGQVWEGEQLSWDQRMLVAITALAAHGHHVQLRNYLHGALQGGMGESTLRQALRMLTVYIGFPTAIQALQILSEVVAAEDRHR